MLQRRFGFVPSAPPYRASHIPLLGASTKSPWTSQKPVPVVPISHSIGALPVYAFYSVVRISIAYLLSLIFAVGYGYIAAYNPRVEAWMIAVLDILQSIPVQ